MVHQTGPERKLLRTHNNKDIKCTQQKNDIKIHRGERTNHIQKQAHLDKARLFNGDSESRRAWPAVLQAPRDKLCHPHNHTPQNYELQWKEKGKLFITMTNLSSAYLPIHLSESTGKKT